VILVAGATGTLGPEVVRLLLARGLDLRVLGRRPDRVSFAPGVEVARGDVGDPDSLRAAVHGASVIVSAVSGFSGRHGGSAASVDRDGNINLIRAARDAGVEHFVMLSVRDAGRGHPMELMRMKFAAEQELRHSGISWTILRPSLFMENWADLVGRPLLTEGRTTIFGRGQNPVNFVSAHDVARFVELAVVDPSMRGRQVDIGGPENLTFREFVDAFQPPQRQGQVRHIPRPVMRAMGRLMPRFKPVLASHARAGVVMDTLDMSFDASPTRSLYPAIPVTTLAEVVQRDHGTDLAQAVLTGSGSLSKA
jgi:NADH dehydrogenase